MQLLVDFIKEVVGAPTVLIGNSIGSLACVIASAGAAPSGLVRGTVLLNCSGGMNNKAINDDWRLQLASPLLWLIDFLLQRPSIATWLFNRVKSRDNLKTILQSIYSNKDAVDDELVEVFIALLLPQSKSLVNFLLFVAFDLRQRDILDKDDKPVSSLTSNMKGMIKSGLLVLRSVFYRSWQQCKHVDKLFFL